jgi:ABC-type transport system involved in cytochrome c biogenesis permease subunit
MNPSELIGLTSFLAVVGLVAFAVFAGRQEPSRHWRLAPWAIAVLLAIGVLLLSALNAHGLGASKSGEVHGGALRGGDAEPVG